jgi:DNA modification methylase
MRRDLKGGMSKDNPEAFETFEFDLPPIRGFPELRWAGKRPFKSTQYFPAQKKESYGDPTDGWWNQIFWGDNLQVMSHLLRDYRGKVDLIYLDPPFDSKADYKKKIGLKGVNTFTDRSSFEESQYADIWTSDGFLQWLYERIILCKEFLREGGSIFIHCDWHKSHQIRNILDEVFTPTGFVNEIIWHYYNKMQGNINKFAGNHDVIFWYKSGGEPKFNKIREKRDKPVQQIKREWSSATQSLVNAKDENGNVIYINSTHRTIDDVWRMSMLQPADKVEPTGYPTQKPEQLVARVIKAASDPGDLIFDPFMGSGTTQAVAMKLGRRFLGSDINLAAVETSIERFNIIRKRHDGNLTDCDLFDEDEQRKPKKFYTGFEVYNVNNYDLFRNPVEAKQLIREAMELQPLPPSSVFDGQREGYLVKIMPVNRIATRQDLNEVINGLDFKAFERRQAEAPNKPVERIHLVCMGHEPDLGPALQKEAKPFDISVMVTDLIRDKAHLHFKKSSDARIAIENGELVIKGFYPMNLLQKLSMDSDAVEDWRQLVESVKVDFHYDGAVLTPAIVDVPGNAELIAGRYPIPADAATIRVKITDLLSESWEGDIENG